MAKIATSFAVASAILGVLELLMGLASMVCAFIHSSKAQGDLYSKFYSSSPANKKTESADPYWWGGVPFLLPGILGLVVVFKRTIPSMVFFIIANVICFFVSIASAIIVGIFIGLWKILYDTYTSGKCEYIYHGNINRLYCRCDVKDVDKFDANTAWVYVDSCDDIRDINTVLVAIIALGCTAAVVCLATAIMGCISFAYQESPYKKSNKQIQQQYLLQQQQAKQAAPPPQQPAFVHKPAPQAPTNIGYQPPPYISTATPQQPRSDPAIQKLGQNEPSFSPML